jgi:hypothetical protein
MKAGAGRFGCGGGTNTEGRKGIQNPQKKQKHSQKEIKEKSQNPHPCRCRTARMGHPPQNQKKKIRREVKIPTVHPARAAGWGGNAQTEGQPPPINV